MKNLILLFRCNAVESTTGARLARAMSGHLFFALMGKVATDAEDLAEGITETK
jgi:hypothetical protein